MLSVNKGYVKAAIDSVRGAIGRTITVYTPKQSACLECVASGYYDVLSDTSWNITCPQCNGAYWISSTDATEIPARVHWVTNEGIQATPGGKYFVGDAWATIDPCYIELARAAQNEAGRVDIDGQKMQIDKILPMGAPEINRVRLILKGMGGRPNE